MSIDNISNNDVNNPFFGSDKTLIVDDEKIEITQKNFYKYFKNIYFVSPLKNPHLSWFEPTITQDNLKDMLDNCLVIQKKITLGKIGIFYEWMKIVSTNVLKKCKIGSLEFEDNDKKLILPIFLLTFDQIKSFMELYNEKDWFENFLINSKIAETFMISQNYFEFKHILDASPTTYWCKENNTNINVTNIFINRNFRWNIFKTSNNSSKFKTIQEMKNYNIKDDNYISMFFKTKGNFDDKFGKIPFKLHRLPKVKNIINTNQFNQIMTDISPKNRFQLFFNILTSPEYCHLVLNNGYIWDMMSDIVTKCRPLVRYVLFYSYLSLYLQENIKKSFLKKEDTCILKLSNACKIPTFPYLQNDINSHPAIAAAHIINESVIPKNNFYGIPLINNSTNSLCNLETFKKRLNIFLTGNSDKNFLCKMNWDNIHITGSVMAACIPKHHQLINLFDKVPEYIKNSDDYIYHRFFSEYYSNADIDVLINIADPVKLYKRAIQFKQDLEQGVLYTEGETIQTNMEFYRKGYFKFNQSFLENKLIPYWEEKGVKLIVGQIINKLTDPDMFKYFKPFYDESKKIFYKKFIEKNQISQEDQKNKYSFFFSEINSEDILLSLYQKIDGKYYKVEKENFNVSNMTTESITDESFNEVIESTKYKITHPLMNHTFELFGVPYDDPWSTINKFHMGQVRGYYDGDEVYLTISALMSYHTNLSPDYRIMYGSKDPAEICNKYRMRGYGVILNKNELAQIITYSENIPFWKNLYKINKKNQSSINDFLSHKKINDELFIPRFINADYYKNAKIYVNSDYNVKNLDYVDSYNKLHSNLIRNCKSQNIIINEIYLKHKFLKENGKPKPLKRWMIDSAWDLFEISKIYEK